MPVVLTLAVICAGIIGLILLLISEYCMDSIDRYDYKYLSDMKPYTVFVYNYGYRVFIRKYDETRYFTLRYKDFKSRDKNDIYYMDVKESDLLCESSYKVYK
jgi:hypothetical protein